MLRHTLVAIITAMIPTILLVFLLVMAFTSPDQSLIIAIPQSFLLGIFGGVINPMTYFVALFLGISSYYIKTEWKRVIFQTVTFATMIILIPLTQTIDAINENVLNVFYIYIGIIWIAFVLSLINLFLGKVVFKKFLYENEKAYLKQRV